MTRTFRCIARNKGVAKTYVDEAFDENDNARRENSVSPHRNLRGVQALMHS